MIDQMTYPCGDQIYPLISFMPVMVQFVVSIVNTPISQVYL